MCVNVLCATPGFPEAQDNDMQQEIERPLLTVKEAADLANVGRSTAYKLAKTEWGAIRVGTVLRISREKFLAWTRGECAGRSK